MSSPVSSGQLTEGSSPLEWVTPYVAGLVDNHASIVVSVARVSDRRVGYRPKHEIRYKGEHRGVFDILECYCAEHGIEPRISERSKSSYDRFKFLLSSRSDIVAFLEPLRPYLVVQNRAVALLVETLIPGLNNGAHTERESFLMWMRLLEEFREESGRANRTKYDFEYFRNEWDLDIDQIAVANYEWVPDSVVHICEAESMSEHKSTTTTLDSLFDSEEVQWVEPYVAALVDVHFDFVISIGKQDSRAVGYKVALLNARRRRGGVADLQFHGARGGFSTSEDAIAVTYDEC